MPEILNQNSQQESVQSAPELKRSYFDGGTLQLIGWRLLAFVITLLTLGIAYPWALCMLARWEAKHTVISGRRLRFTGKGIGLWGRFLLWCLLSVLTLGIYGIWLCVNVRRWRVAHTVYADEEDTPGCFTGGAGGLFWNRLVLLVLTVFTLGIGYAWGKKRLLRWEAKHTCIGGSPLVFSGTGGQLLGKSLLFLLLTVLTAGIYALFIPVAYRKWKYAHTASLSGTMHYARLSRAHEQTVLRDAQQFRMADLDTQLEMVKSGISSEESEEVLRAAVSCGNRIAMYELAVRLKEDEEFDGEALELLRSAALAGYPPAMLDYARSVGSAQGALYTELLERSARGGNSQAAWLLKQYYEAAARRLHGHGGYDSAEQLQRAAYWFAIAMEMGNAYALAEKKRYDKLVETVALWMTQRREPGRKPRALPAVLVILAVLLVAGAAAGALWYRQVYLAAQQTDPPPVVQLRCDGRILGADTEIFQSVPWEPGVVSFENMEIVNTGSETVSFTLRLGCAQGGSVIHAVALERKVSTGDLESVMKWDPEFVPLEDFILTGTLAPGETYRTAVILYWPGGETPQVPAGMTLPALLDIRADFDTQ